MLILSPANLRYHCTGPDCIALYLRLPDRDLDGGAVSKIPEACTDCPSGFSFSRSASASGLKSWPGNRRQAARADRRAQSMSRPVAIPGGFSFAALEIAMTPEQEQLLREILEELRALRVLADNVTQGGDAMRVEGRS